MGRKLIDLTGQRFGKLVAIKYTYDSKWLCQCDCGRQYITKSYHLRSGRCRSCGCLYGKPAKFTGCDDNCFTCKYPDCLKPDYLCNSKVEANDD